MSLGVGWQQWLSGKEHEGTFWYGYCILYLDRGLDHTCKSLCQNSQNATLKMDCNFPVCVNIFITKYWRKKNTVINFKILPSLFLDMRSFFPLSQWKWKYSLIWANKLMVLCGDSLLYHCLRPSREEDTSSACPEPTLWPHLPPTIIRNRFPGRLATCLLEQLVSHHTMCTFALWLLVFLITYNEQVPIKTFNSIPNVMEKYTFRATPGVSQLPRDRLQVTLTRFTILLPIINVSIINMSLKYWFFLTTFLQDSQNIFFFVPLQLDFFSLKIFKPHTHERAHVTTAYTGTSRHLIHS